MRSRRPTERAPIGAPLLIINFKAVPSALGEGALEIGRALDRLGKKAKIATAVAAAAPDIGRLAGALSLPVLAQHIDPVAAGSRTGYMVAEAVRAAGGLGTLVNHSEHPLRPRAIREILQRLRDTRLVGIVCARGLRDARALAREHPSYLAIEPPELIGGDISVSSAEPELLSRAAREIQRISPATTVLCGAGVHNRTDVRKALELGTDGVLVASAVTRAANPAEAIRELLAGFRR